MFTKRHVAAAAGLVVAVIAAPVTATAAVSGGAEVASIERLANAVAPPIGRIVEPEPIGAVLRTQVPSGMTSIPLDPTEDLAITSDALDALGVNLTIGLPSSATTGKATVTPEGRVAYATADPVDADLIVEQTAEALRVQTVIAESASPTEFEYAIGGGVSMRLSASGGVEFCLASGGTEVVVGGFEAPWATDAAGNAVSTRFEVRGDVVVQVVDHREDGVVYPVVADPTMNQINAFQWRIRFDDSETATLANSGWSATGVSAVCALAGSAAAGPAGAAAAGAVCLAYAGTLVYEAGVAVNSSPARCVQLTWTSTAPLWSPGITWIDTYGC